MRPSLQLERADWDDLRLWNRGQRQEKGALWNKGLTWLHTLSSCFLGQEGLCLWLRNLWAAKLQPSANMQSHLSHAHTHMRAIPRPTPTFLQRDALDRGTVSEAAAVATPGFVLLRSPLPRPIAWPYLIVPLSRWGMDTTLRREGAFKWWGGR